MGERPSPSVPGVVTTLLQDAREGRQGALDELFVVVYDELRAMAQSKVNSIAAAPGDLDGTALVHAACARLMGDRMLSAVNRRHFFFLFLRAMNDALVEQARHDLAIKRGGDRHHHHLSNSGLGIEELTQTTDLQDLRNALQELSRVDPDGAQMVMLRFAGGRTLREAAEIMGCSLAVARNHWDYARAWLLERMGGDAEGPSGPNA